MTRLAVGTAIVVLTLIGLAVLWQLREAIVLFLLSLATAAAVRPFVDYVGQSGWRRFFGLTGTYLVGLAALVTLVIVTVGLLLGELQSAADEFVHVYEHVAEVWPQGNWLEKAIAHRVPHPEHLYAALAGPEAGGAWKTILGSAFGLAASFVNIVVIVVLSIYWTTDRVHFERLWLSQLPLRQRFAAREIWRSLESEIGGYFRSEVIQSVLAGVLLWTGYELLGLRYPTLAAAIAALALLLPWFGMPVALACLVLLAMPTMVVDGIVAAMGTLLPAMIYTLIVLVLLEVLIEPRILNRRRYNSLLMAVAVIALAETFGILGFLLGPPLAVAMQVLAEHLIKLKITPPIQPEPLPLADLGTRLAAVRASLAVRQRASPNLNSLVDRLSVLLEQTLRIETNSATSAATDEPSRPPESRAGSTKGG